MDGELERRFADLVVARGLVPPAAVRQAVAGRRPGRTLAETLCESGALDRNRALSLLDELRGAGSTAPPGSDRFFAPVGSALLPADRSGSDRLPPRQAKMLGPYELVAELGRGSMGVVWRAVDTRLRRDVALKVLTAAPDGDALEPFLREARASARLRHPGIVVLYGAEVVEGRAVVALELVEGGSLAQRLKDEKAKLSPREAARIVAELSDAVQAAHGEGVIHRDLKPANVLIDRAGRPRLTDFGLARDERASVKVTAMGDVLGSPCYMAPEQARGDVDVIGPRTDVYGLGAVLYECIVGRPPFVGSTGVEVLRKVVDEALVPPSTARTRAGLEPVAPDLETICLQALRKEPHRRYATAADLGADLRRWLDGRPISARPAGALERVGMALRRTRAPAAVGAAVVVTLVVAASGSGAWGRWQDGRRVDAALRQVEAGAVRSRPAAREELLLVLLQSRTPATARRVAAALDAVTVELVAARAEALRAVLNPVDDAERLRQPKLVPLGEALERLAADPPGTPLAPAHAAALREARHRLLVRLRAAKDPDAAGHRGAEVHLGRQQSRRLGDDRLALASVCCEALGRLGVPEGADALGRYLFAEEDEVRAIPAGEALTRLPGVRPLWLVQRAAERYGDEGRFSQHTTRALKALGAPPTFEPTTGVEHRDRGELRWLFRDEAGALADFARALALDPKDARAYADRGEVHAYRSRWEQALPDLTRAIELEPEEPRHWCSRAAVRAESNDLDGAVSDASKALELDPSDVNTWLARADVRATRRLDLEGALEDCTQALALDPALADALVSRASVRRLLNDQQRALEDLNRAIELDATKAGAYGQRGMLLEELGRIDDALADHEKALALDGKRASSWSRRGWLKANRGDLPGALADLTKAIELDPKLGEPHALRGRVHAMQGDLDAAIADCDRACELDPRLASAWANRAIVKASHLRDYVGAIPDLDKALALDPNELGTLSWRGFSRLNTGDNAGAVEDLTRALALRPNDATMVCSRGIAYVGLHQLEPALIDFARAAELKPGWAEPWARSAEARTTVEDWEGVLRDAARALRCEPEHARALECRGAARVRLGDPAAGIADFEILLRLLPPGAKRDAVAQAVDDLRAQLAEQER